MLLMFSLLPLLSGCDNEDDVIGIFTGKTWKLSRLTNKGSNAQFYPNLWNNNEEEMKKRVWTSYIIRKAPSPSILKVLNWMEN